MSEDLEFYKKYAMQSLFEDVPYPRPKSDIGEILLWARVDKADVEFILKDGRRINFSVLKGEFPVVDRFFKRRWEWMRQNSIPIPQERHA